MTKEYRTIVLFGSCSFASFERNLGTDSEQQREIKKDE